MRALFCIVLICSFIVCEDVMAQEKWSLSAGINYGSFTMEDPTLFQQEVIAEIPVAVKTIDEFPNYFGFEGKLYYRPIHRLSAGIFFAVNSSGSRASYQDYSGSFEFNQFARMTQAGIGAELHVSSQESPLDIFFGIRFAKGWTYFNVNDKLILDSEVVLEDDLDFESGHITIHPSFGLRRKVVEKLFVEAQAGYLLDSAEDLKYKEDNSLKLIAEQGNAVAANWSGFRLSLSVGISF